ncbi:PRC-barrel domain-containing protein [Winogradskyella bathintestinalis]|uniref:PRC-barrel domain-containing protein n=1 Tax=Winogradskyella bathintestinalis TaxID=3035208 RepID=A0ABT7ZRN1_9FLAO|nr:PRC-barrel domain-containing protein [Winogradskyella bathintestinalis]MDN3491659.1 PRC-barrel domain-containing protein [Winogradskyella bathintestinalis]
MSTNNEKSVYYLEELSNYKVADSDKDVRGWDVKDKDGRVIGTVDNLIVNKNTERVVYLDVEVDSSIIEANYKPYSAKAKDGVHDFINEKGENHLIIPIGMAHLNLESELVFTKEVNHKTFAETKRLKKGTDIYRDYEILILDSYNRNDDVASYPQDEMFYERSEFKVE